MDWQEPVAKIAAMIFDICSCSQEVGRTTTIALKLLNCVAALSLLLYFSIWGSTWKALEYGQISFFSFLLLLLSIPLEYTACRRLIVVSVMGCMVAWAYLGTFPLQDLNPGLEALCFVTGICWSCGTVVACYLSEFHVEDIDLTLYLFALNTIEPWNATTSFNSELHLLLDVRMYILVYSCIHKLDKSEDLLQYKSFVFVMILTLVGCVADDQKAFEKQLAPLGFVLEAMIGLVVLYEVRVAMKDPQPTEQVKMQKRRLQAKTISNISKLVNCVLSGSMLIYFRNSPWKALEFAQICFLSFLLALLAVPLHFTWNRRIVVVLVMAVNIAWAYFINFSLEEQTSVLLAFSWVSALVWSSGTIVACYWGEMVEDVDLSLGLLALNVIGISKESTGFNNELHLLLDLRMFILVYNCLYKFEKSGDIFRYVSFLIVIALSLGMFVGVEVHGLDPTKLDPLVLVLEAVIGLVVLFEVYRAKGGRCCCATTENAPTLETKLLPVV